MTQLLKNRLRFNIITKHPKLDFEVSIGTFREIFDRKQNIAC